MRTWDVLQEVGAAGMRTWDVLQEVGAAGSGQLAML